MFGFGIITGPASEAADHDVFGALLQYPSTTGEVSDISDIIAAVQAKKRHSGSSRRPNELGVIKIAR